jgi:hypothetical protein
MKFSTRNFCQINESSKWKRLETLAVKPLRLFYMTFPAICAILVVTSAVKYKKIIFLFGGMNHGRTFVRKLCHVKNIDSG